MVFKIFKHLQLTQEVDKHEEFIAAKKDLSNRLIKLNDTLNHHLYNATASNIPYDEWLKSHQPFNWIAEFYDIIHGNGGFDVIIGNPPYVEYSKRNVNYEVLNYQTLKSANLYSFVFERSFLIGKDKIAFIVQLSSVGTIGMKSLQDFLIKASSHILYGCFPERPKQLFEGACIALSILICEKKNQPTNNKANLIGTGVYRTAESARNILFKNIQGVEIPYELFIKEYSLFPKFKTNIEISIFNKILREKPISTYIGVREVDNSVTYRTAGGRYWKIFLNRPFANESTSNKNKPLQHRFNKNLAVGILNSNLFWVYYVNYFDLYNLKDYMIFNFPYEIGSESPIVQDLGTKLMISYEAHKVENTQFIKSRNQTAIFESFNPSMSKHIIDSIDRVLAKHYGFTEEELDFIINYDIKYRMGDELNNSDE